MHGVDDLKDGFFKFLHEYCPTASLRPEDITDELLVEFRTWLTKQKRAIDGKPYHPKYVGRKLGALRSILASLSTGKWVAIACSVAQRVPFGPQEITKHNTPIEVLSVDTLVNIIRSCENEVLAFKARWEQGEILLREGRVKICAEDVDLKDLSVCLALLADKYPGVVPNVGDFKKEFPELGLRAKKHGIGKLTCYLYPSARDLIPFVILLAVVTVFNADTVRSLRWDHIDRDVDNAGSLAILIVGEKARANADPVRVLDPNPGGDGQLGLGELLEILEKVTARIRRFANEEDAEDLFLYVPETKTKRVATLMDKNIGQSGVSWTNGLKNFIKDSNLPHFALDQIRPTIIDLVQIFGGGLEEAKAIGDHSKIYTTWISYTSDGTKKKNRESIGIVTLLRERWFTTAGRIDPRKLLPWQDKGAATPGFLCADPFDSPLSNQRGNILCNAYGECPGCPNAGALPLESLCVAHYFALQKSIFESRYQMSPETWVQRWEPQLIALNNLLGAVPSEVVEDSKSFSVTLPMVG
ncbi:hypothetical protein [Cupriavidus sp. YR651]|uniref:hypothetical protein n=1 Tax=Cupriavidus sp. YR651 TaxID=1855315 RepID=UPI00115FAD50|nr:hypothetical protein [Cupriavidus sp. YR651]